MKHSSGDNANTEETSFQNKKRSLFEPRWNERTKNVYSETEITDNYLMY